MRSRARKLIVAIPLAILGFAVFIVIGGAFVMLLWNWLLPPLFGWPEIGFWQALGLLALCRVLFGGHGFRTSTSSKIRGRIAERVSERMSERMEHMTPEERERFRQRIRERWGFGPREGEPKGE